MVVTNPWILLVVIAVVTAISAIIQSALGLGYAMFAQATIALLLGDPILTTAVVSVGMMVSSVDCAIKTRKHINYKIAMPPLVGLLVGKAAGVIALMHIDAGTTTVWLGILLILFSAYFCFASNRVKITPTPAKGVVFGILSGFLGGMFNITGPIAAIYLYSATNDKYEYTASLNFIFGPCSLIGLIMHIAYGNFGEKIVPISIASILAALIGVKLGLLLLGKVNKKQLSRMLFIYMAVVGVALIV